MTYPIPTAALDDRLGFVGTSGSGKTYCAGDDDVFGDGGEQFGDGEDERR